MKKYLFAEKRLMLYNGIFGYTKKNSGHET